jgi:hypothetical protein
VFGDRCSGVILAAETCELLKARLNCNPHRFAVVLWCIASANLGDAMGICQPNDNPDLKQIIDRTMALFAVYTGATLSFFVKDFLFSAENLKKYTTLADWLQYWGFWISLAVVALLLRYILGSACHLNQVYIAKTTQKIDNNKIVTDAQTLRSANICWLFVLDSVRNTGCADYAGNRQCRDSDDACHLFYHRWHGLVAPSLIVSVQPAGTGTCGSMVRRRFWADSVDLFHHHHYAGPILAGCHSGCVVFVIPVV